MNDNRPYVSVVIPCLNEERYIGRCLDSIVANGCPGDNLEILVIDGMSEDRTAEIVKQYCERHPFIRILNNPGKIVSKALNIGIQSARGEVIIRMDAHTVYENNYIINCVKYLEEYGADNVGGIWVTLPGSDTPVAQSISFALSHPFGVGGAKFRTGTDRAMPADTVPFGCYRREVFQKIGMFDEELVRNQDDELNYRLKKSGGKIYLVPGIKSYYYARPTLSKLWSQYLQYGYWKVRVIQKHGLPASWGHIVPVMLVLGLAGGAVAAPVSRAGVYILALTAGSYLALTAFFSAQISAKKGLRYLFILPLAFGTIHFSYGFGFLKGLFDFAIFSKHLKGRRGLNR